MYKVSCECCGKLIDDKTAYYTEENLAYCPKCTDAMRQPCRVCGDMHPIWDMNANDNGEVFCDECFASHEKDCTL